MAELRIAEIYRSLQGESSFAGWPCTFVRTAGCDIRCGYCDEPAALRAGERVSMAQVLDRVRALGCELVEVTGGEPLLQPAVPALVEALLKEDYRVLIETGGHRDISVLDSRCHVILDVKTPGSGMVQVQADYAYQPLTGSFLETFGFGTGNTALNVTLTAAVTMRAL